MRDTCWYVNIKSFFMLVKNGLSKVVFNINVLHRYRIDNYRCSPAGHCKSDYDCKYKFKNFSNDKKIFAAFFSFYLGQVTPTSQNG